MLKSDKQFEIFSGTGGVGKTTLATSRAIYLAKQNKRVLLITIDPAKRLKEILGMKDEDVGNTVKITDPLGDGSGVTLDAQLMNPEATIQRIAAKSKTPDITKNRVLNILSRPYGGLNEILAIVELQINYEKNTYDVIVLDTPPGTHFLDFLESVEKINAFFDQSFVDIFNYLGKKVSNTQSAPKRLVTMVVSTGVKKLIGYLSQVTGASFVDDFMDAVSALYDSKETFMQALDLQKKLKNHTESNWFLVTSVDQSKVHEAMELREHATDFLTGDTFVILNKCLGKNLTDWNPEADDILGNKLKESFVSKENELTQIVKSKFKNIIEFKEVLKVSPIDHIKELVDGWTLPNME